MHCDDAPLVPSLDHLVELLRQDVPRDCTSNLETPPLLIELAAHDASVEAFIDEEILQLANRRQLEFAQQNIICNHLYRRENAHTHNTHARAITAIFTVREAYFIRMCTCSMHTSYILYCHIYTHYALVDCQHLS